MTAQELDIKKIVTIQKAKETVDVLAMALANHNHSWTAKERKLYDSFWKYALEVDPE